MKQVTIMKQSTKIIGLSLCIIASVYACKSKKIASVPPPPPATAQEPPKAKSICDDMALTYTKDIKPLLDAYCVYCHNTQKKSNGIDLSSYEWVKEEAGKDRFMGSIEHKAGYSPMPRMLYTKPIGPAPGPPSSPMAKITKLSDSTIQVINCWIENGRNL